MSTRALGMPVPGPWSVVGSEKRELREPVGEQLRVRRTHPAHPTPPGPCSSTCPAQARRTHPRCACQPGYRGQGLGAGAHHHDPSNSRAASASAGLTAIPGSPSRLPPGTASQPWQALALWRQERSLQVCIQPGHDPILPWPTLSPTQVVEIILNAVPRVLLNERLHKAPGLLPVADLRGHSRVGEMGAGSDSSLAAPLPGGAFLSNSERALCTHRQNRCIRLTHPSLPVIRAHPKCQSVSL